MKEDIFRVQKLGDCKYLPPFSELNSSFRNGKRIRFDPQIQKEDDPNRNQSFEIAGPSRRIFFDAATTKAAIVTCGGLCPGLNAVIRTLVLQLFHRYGVQDILGIRYGYNGLTMNTIDEAMNLTPKIVENIHEQGGTILGSSRGTPSTAEIVDCLEKKRINILFTIGGDGTMRGANAICQEVKERKLNISVIGIPKTIDNDIPFVKRSFGFESAVEKACEVVIAAHEEARGARGGIGLVKLMGRHAGYIAANTTLATGHVNFCLVPEVPFKLTGEHGFLNVLDRRLTKAGHAVIVVAEGAGQEFFSDAELGRDASGNSKLGDIGVWLKNKINGHFAGRNDRSLKYIDPSYVIRSTPANPGDRLFCSRMAQNAVHVAMAGSTGLLIGYWHGQMTHVPFTALENQAKKIEPTGELWFNVLEVTGQPENIGT